MVQMSVDVRYFYTCMLDTNHDVHTAVMFYEFCLYLCARYLMSETVAVLLCCHTLCAICICTMSKPKNSRFCHSTLQQRMVFSQL